MLVTNAQLSPQTPGPGQCTLHSASQCTKRISRTTIIDPSWSIRGRLRLTISCSVSIPRPLTGEPPTLIRAPSEPDCSRHRRCVLDFQLALVSQTLCRRTSWGASGPMLYVGRGDASRGTCGTMGISPPRPARTISPRLDAPLATNNRADFVTIPRLRLLSQPPGFKDLLRQRCCNFYTSPEGLASRVLASQAQAREDFLAWVGCGKICDRRERHGDFQT